MTFRQYGVKNPRHSQNIVVTEKCYVYRGTRLTTLPRRLRDFLSLIAKGRLFTHLLAEGHVDPSHW